MCELMLVSPSKQYEEQVMPYKEEMSQNGGKYIENKKCYYMDSGLFWNYAFLYNFKCSSLEKDISNLFGMDQYYRYNDMCRWIYLFTQKQV